MSRTFRNRPERYGYGKYRTRDLPSCYCCSQKQQRLGMAKGKRMKHSDACRAQSERDL
jgi:hypothetical protein